MKPYFAKYLLVEGEIRKGDLVFKHDCVPKIYEHVPTTNPWYKDEKRVKLFLCSRDIKVGDKVRSNYDGHPELEGTFDKIKGDYSYFTNPYGEQVMWITKEEVPYHVFKVIGEISPEATWVKEGDEFDETEVIALEWGGASVRKPIKMIRKEFYGDGHYPKIFVKCPTCKKFH